MTDMTIPAPVEVTGSTDTAAPQVTTQDVKAETIAKPQAETPAGEPQAQEPAGDDQQKQTWKEKRAERNRERWQQYKQAKEVIPQQLAALQAQLRHVQDSLQPPDYSRFTDPAEELAARTAYQVRQELAKDTERRYAEQQRQVATDYQSALDQARIEVLEEAREKFPDFDEHFNKVPVHELAVRHIVESENPAELAYYLGRNPKEARSLYEAFERDPYSALIRFGEVRAKVASAPAKIPTSAPKPAAVLSGGQSPLAFDASRASVEDMAAHLKRAGLIR